MPIYEYHCRACGGDTEVMHKFSDPPATVCPACGKPELTKQVSAAGFRLGGSGWYETDFKKKSDKQKNVAGADKAPEKKDAAADKPAEKKEAAAPAAKPAASAPATPASSSSST
jgi:putative FmdB family regulatory protein